MLTKKLLRDFGENKGAYAACLIIIIIGLMVFTALSMSADNLTASQQKFYSDCNFADGFIEMDSVSPEKISKLKKIKGIDDALGRIVKDVNVISLNTDDNVYLRLVSIDTKSPNPINDVKLMQGIPLHEKQRNIWVDNSFFEANALKLNDKLSIIADGKKQELSIVGVGQSPEFVYALRSSSDLAPSPQNFGIAFVPLEIMQRLFSESKINSIVFTLEDGFSYDDVEHDLKNELKFFGIKSIYPREDQLSHFMLTQEIDSTKTMAKGIPFVFLSIAAAIMFNMLKRKIEEQRGLIGILKALGYTSKEIMFHYLSYALILGVVGGILGGLIGLWLSHPLTSFYGEFFNMPELSGGFDFKYPTLGVFLSAGFSALAGFFGCSKALKLEPAEAMRPPAPLAAKKTLLENIPIFWENLTSQGKMALRNLSRNKGRSLFIFVGIMLCFAICGFTWSMNDMMQLMMFDQYEKIETYDIKLSLKKPAKEDQVYDELVRFPGMQRVEPMAEIPVTLQNRGLEQDVVLFGLKQDGLHYNILDKNYNKISLPDNGILLSERLAKLLDAEKGTWLALESDFSRRDDVKLVRVEDIIPQYLGMGAYMRIESLENLLEQGSLITSFTLSIKEKNIKPFKDKYMQSPIIDTIDEKMSRLRQTEELMEVMGSLIYVYALVGIVLGFAIIYNSSIITFSERARELATMLVLGMTTKEVMSVITFEQWFLGFFAMLAGIPLSKLILMGLSQSMSTDIYTIPTVITTSSYIMSFATTSIAIWIAQKASASKIKALSLIEVLKSRE